MNYTYYIFVKFELKCKAEQRKTFLGTFPFHRQKGGDKMCPPKYMSRASCLRFWYLNQYLQHFPHVWRGWCWWWWPWCRDGPDNDNSVNGDDDDAIPNTKADILYDKCRTRKMTMRQRLGLRSILSPCLSCNYIWRRTVFPERENGGQRCEGKHVKELALATLAIQRCGCPE